MPNIKFGGALIEQWINLHKKIEVKGYQVIRVMYTTEYLLKNASTVTELCIKEIETDIESKNIKEESKINKTITINLVDFNFLDCDKFHSYYHLYEDELKVQLTDIIEIHFVELKKFEKIDKRINDKLHNWISFINNPNGEGVESMAIADNDIKSARDILTIISGDKEVKELAELREKSLKDEISRISGAREEGIKEGIKEGIEKEKISNAKNLLKLGVDVEIVAKGTSLSIEEVIKLKNEQM